MSLRACARFQGKECWSLEECGLRQTAQACADRAIKPSELRRHRRRLLAYSPVPRLRWGVDRRGRDRLSSAHSRRCQQRSRPPASKLPKQVEEVESHDGRSGCGLTGPCGSGSFREKSKAQHRRNPRALRNEIRSVCVIHAPSRRRFSFAYSSPRVHDLSRVCRSFVHSSKHTACFR